MEWFVNTFRQYPELAIFLTIALGFFIGKFKYGTFSLGNVTSVLLVTTMLLLNTSTSRTEPFEYKQGMEAPMFQAFLDKVLPDSIERRVASASPTADSGKSETGHCC